MSQDDIICAKCGKMCGYDDEKGYWPEHSKALCSMCKNNLISRFSAFFGINSVSSEYMGMEIEWEDMYRILSNVKLDSAWRISYIVTDKEQYERIKKEKVSVAEE